MMLEENEDPILDIPEDLPLLKQKGEFGMSADELIHMEMKARVAQAQCKKCKSKDINLRLKIKKDNEFIYTCNGCYEVWYG